MITIIVAADLNGVIANNNVIPWSLPEDIRRFRNRTMGHSVIMGRVTYENLPKRPLLGRINYVVSRRPAPRYPHRTMAESLAGPIWLNSLDKALEDAKKNKLEDGTVKKIFIIGGEQIYNLALESNIVNRIILTKMNHEYRGNKYFKVPTNWLLVEREPGVNCDVLYFVNPEHQDDTTTNHVGTDQSN